MSVQSITHEIRLQHWGRIVKECRGSGKTIKAWCAEQPINLKTYYHWQKLVYQETCRELAMTRKQTPAPVLPSGPVLPHRSRQQGKLALTIQRNDVQIYIYCDADAAIVEVALNRLC